VLRTQLLSSKAKDFVFIKPVKRLTEHRTVIAKYIEGLCLKKVRKIPAQIEGGLQNTGSLAEGRAAL
jgi:hypothetical protein